MLAQFHAFVNRFKNSIEQNPPDLCTVSSGTTTAEGTSMVNLIERIQKGDRQAFAALFEQYKNLVFRTAYLMLDSREEAEDALQEIFIQLSRTIGSYDPAKAAFTTWLHRITVNYCLNQRRRKSFFFSPLHLLPERLIASREPSVEDQVLEDAALRRALDRLSDKLRVVVVLRFYLDLSYAEMAETLQLPIGTVQSRLNQALKKLKLELAPLAADMQPARRVSHSEEENS
jgi:RNA polymerase sigma-70 factor, ECF subfamily